uniref:RING-type domain-containing protein n=1 Tax=Chenopodium quinoa TaxID=63459 RepID=A0A803LP92_CHEQI
MGAACCVASRDKAIQPGSSGEFLHRNFRHSPTWSFRWDSRVGVAGEDTSVGWLSDVASRNDGLDVKSATDVSAQVSDGGSSLESYRTGAWRKSPVNQDTTKSLKTSASGESAGRNACTEVKQSTESPPLSDPASVKLSPSVHTTSSASESHSSGRNSPSNNSVSEEGQVPFGNSAVSNVSTRGSYGRSSDGWSAHAFSELMSASQRERWSFDSDSCSFPHDKLCKTSVRNSRSISIDFQTCGICSKLLSEKSPWSTQKFIAGNELSVVAVLICEHVYHAECLETITPEVNKYDPACPVCTFGEKQTLKLAGKMLKAEKDLKARSSKKSRNRVVDTNASFDFDSWKRSAGAHEGKSPKLGNSSSLKISAAKPFLKRHFSFGSRGNKSASESPSIRKKGLFWAKSSRE